jgi:hypothetical protein
MERQPNCLSTVRMKLKYRGEILPRALDRVCPFKPLNIGIFITNLLDLKKKDIHSSDKLAEMMGFSIDTSNPNKMTVTSIQQDPQCRFM